MPSKCALLYVFNQGWCIAIRHTLPSWPEYSDVFGVINWVRTDFTYRDLPLYVF